MERILKWTGLGDNGEDVMDEIENILYRIIFMAYREKRRSTMFWNVADFLERKGYLTGLLMVFAPIAYDVVGIFYGRDAHVKVQDFGSWMQIVGGIIILLARIARRWGKK